ncbi:enoyl-CoA hydratase [Nakamurella sp. YIM 132087]|uniref:Enoyl-CoA hydratase n=2 Tax=Nakamurella alba TaxID=2665158 RepID=A0A7K1FU79_9ACTN|nr:enoyl-CoA hydratase [Nakamurella alba]
MVTLNRPDKLNAFTPAMFRALEELAGALATDSTTRVLVFRGAGGRAFAAGADIGAFTTFDSTDDAVAYEAGIVRTVRAVQHLPQVTLAVIEGLAVGGGLALATACDLRIATTGSRVGYPIAATLGNCLSDAVLERCVAAFGESLVREMILTARLLDIGRAYAAGAVLQVVDPAELDGAVTELTERMAHLSPGTQLSTKRILDALAAGTDTDNERHIRKVYGSPDFSGAVRAFLAKEKPVFRADLDLDS